MEKNTFGKVSASYRKRYGLQRKVIYEGICSPATFTRAETEERNLDFLVIETLLARMGKRSVGFESMLREEDGALWEKRLEIKVAMSNGDYPAVDRGIQEYRLQVSQENWLHEQFCLYYEMKLAERNGKDQDKVCKLAARALALTKEKFDLPDQQNNLYTPMEMDMLLALFRNRQGEWKASCRVESGLLDIVRYMEICYQEDRHEDIEGDVWLELIKVSECSDENGKELYYIEKALKCFDGTTGIRRLAELHFIKAKLIERWKRAGDGCKDWLRECMEECRMAHTIYAIMGMDRERNAVEKYCEEELQWHITI